MYVPFFALPLMTIVFAADDVPKFDVTPSCRGAAAAGYVAATEDRLQSCLASEQRTHDSLAKDWSTFPPADRAYCVGSMGNFQPTYTELATCLEMKRNVKTGGSEPPPEATTTRPGRIRQPRPQ